MRARALRALPLVVVSLGIGAAVFRALTRCWCAIRAVCFFVFRPGHELRALLCAAVCCAVVGGMTYCPAVS